MPRLTRREEEVLAAIGRGLRGKAIAAELGISEFTVRKHRASMVRKLGLRSAAQLIAHAFSVAEGATDRGGPFPIGRSDPAAA